jgi:iron complex outermembrane receptor protein
MYKIISILCCSIVLSAAAYAAQDENSDQAPGGQAQDEDKVLEEVTVYAQRTRVATKTDALITEIPQSISIITSDLFEERGAVNYQDVFRYSAGVDTERSGLEVRSDFFSARGFALRQYLDGLNTTPDFIYGSRLEVFMLERAEVLRGPSAVLYGAGSSGGLLNAVTKRPEFEFGGEVGVKVGNFERLQFQGDVTGPLSENVAGRFVGVARTGELLSDGQDDNRYTVNPSLTWHIGEDTELTLIGLYQKEDMGTHTYTPTSKTLLANPPEDPPIAHDTFIGEPGFNHMDNDRYSLTALFSHRFSDLISFRTNNRYLTQTTDYAEVYGFPPWEDAARTIIGREFYVLDADYDIFNSDSNLLFTFDTGSLSHNVLVGIDYTLFEHERQEGFSCRGFTGGTCWSQGSPPGLDVYNPVYGLPFTYGFTNAYATESTQLGIYLQDEIRWGDRLSIVIGGRYDESTSERIGAVKFDNDSDTYKFGVIWEAVDGFSPYLSYAESFTPLFGTNFYGVPYQPQEAEQWEAGIKWQPLPASLVTVSYFDIEETGFLSRDPDNIQNMIQGGAIGATGFEVEALVNFDNGFGFTAAYTALDSEILQGTSSQPSGARPPNLPEKLYSAWLTQDFAMSSGLHWRVGAGARYRGNEVDGPQLTVTPAVTLVDAVVQAFYEDWFFAFNVNNLTDKEYYASCGVSTCAPGQTRVYFFEVSKRF